MFLWRFSITSSWWFCLTYTNIPPDQLSLMVTSSIGNFPALMAIYVLMMTSSNGHIFRVTDSLCGESPVTGEFPAQRPVARSFVVFFDLRLKNGWVNNREACDLRGHRAHYDVTIMCRAASLVLGEWYARSDAEIPCKMLQTYLRPCEINNYEYIRSDIFDILASFVTYTTRWLCPQVYH